MQVTCSKCSGNKTYRGMGSLTIKCEPCNGLGSIELDTKLSEPKDKTESPKKATKEKRNAKEEAKREQGAS
jgi:hypothetical protein